jgi:hypothetical protein
LCFAQTKAAYITYASVWNKGLHVKKEESLTLSSGSPKKLYSSGVMDSEALAAEGRFSEEDNTPVNPTNQI